MSRKRIILPVILLTFAISCLKAKRSPFDMNSSSGAGAGFLVAAGIKPTSSSSISSQTPSSSYTGSRTFKSLVPGEPFTFDPKFTGQITAISISPSADALPPGITFDSKTGIVSGTPIAQSTAFPLTTFTITVTGPNGNFPLPFDISVLGSGDTVWTVISGASGSNTTSGINSIKYDPTCNCIYIGGKTNGNLDGQTIPSTGGNDSGFVSRYDLNGNKIWTRVFGVSAASPTDVTGLVTDSSGNVYLTGYALAGNFHGCNLTVRSGYVVKYDSNGNFQWTSCSAPSSNHYYSGVVIDNNGDVVAAGSTYVSPINGMSHSSGSDQAIILQKFNPSTGSRISGSIVPGNGALGTDAYGVSIDSAGKIYVAGVGRASSYCGSGTPAYWRPILIRFDSSMTYIGCSFIPVSSSTFSFGITATSSGESYFSGYGSATIDSIAPIGTEDGFVTKFDNAGVKQWTRRFGIAGSGTTINSVVYEPTGNLLYFTGMTRGNLQGNIINGSQDMFIAKYDTSGNQIWLNIQGIQNDTLPCSGQGCSSGITFDSKKTMYSFGFTNGTVSGISNPATPNRSIFLVRNVQ